MGAVYEATDTAFPKDSLRLPWEDDERVAVKVCSIATEDEELAWVLHKRFEREALALQQIDGDPWVLRYLNRGHDDDLGIDYLVTNYLDGEPLVGLLRRTAPIPPLHALEILHHAALGIARCHQAGIIHRDIKPSNLVLRDSSGPVVTVIDLGIVGWDDPKGLLTRLTHTGKAPYTPRYASPEQMAGAKSLTPATDVYSLGVILYEMLVGQPIPLGKRPRVEDVTQLSEPTNQIIGLNRVRATIEFLFQHMLHPDPVRRISIDALWRRLQALDQELIRDIEAAGLEPAGFRRDDGRYHSRDVADLRLRFDDRGFTFWKHWKLCSEPKKERDELVFSLATASHRCRVGSYSGWYSRYGHEGDMWYEARLVDLPTREGLVRFLDGIRADILRATGPGGRLLDYLDD